MTPTLARLAIVGAVLLAAGAKAGPTHLPVVMTGSWAGFAQIADPWSELPTIEVMLFIAPDGTASGSIGGAILRDARLGRNRGIFARFLRVRTDWVVTGALHGALISSEGLRATRATVPLNWVRDHFEGTVLAYGMNPAGARTPILTARRLRLSRLR